MITPMTIAHTAGMIAMPAGVLGMLAALDLPGRRYRGRHVRRWWQR